MHGTRLGLGVVMEACCPAAPGKITKFHPFLLQYTYSGLRLEPERWHPSIASLKQRVEAATGAAFNSCLLNFYRRWAWGMLHCTRLPGPLAACREAASVGAPSVAVTWLRSCNLCLPCCLDACSGADSIGWHSDSEPLYGREPTIATVSLGDARDFLLRRNADHSERCRFRLGGGALLVMSGPVQEQVGGQGRRCGVGGCCSWLGG